MHRVVDDIGALIVYAGGTRKIESQYLELWYIKVSR